MNANFRFSLKLKLLIAFGVLGIVFVLIYKGQNDTQKTISSNVEENLGWVYPSMVHTEKLRDLIVNSQYLTTKYTLKCDPRDQALKGEIESCHGEQYDSLKSQLNKIVEKNLWSKDNYELLNRLISTTDTLFALQKELKEESLSTVDKFGDATNYSFRKFSVVDGEMASCYKRAIALSQRLANSFARAELESLETMSDGFNNSDKNLMLSIVIGVAFIIVMVFLINLTISKVNYVKGKIKEMAEGSLPDIEVTGHDEIGEISNILKTLVSNLKETSQFAIKIGEGDFACEFHPKSKRDVLANSLLVMRDNLIKAEKDAEQRKIENSQRNWASQGLAEFNEVLRNAGDHMQVLSNRVVEKLVRYLDANMGGIYILDDSDPKDKHLELTAFYAYDRLKYAKQRIEIGENLVGQCFRENETVYMTDLPKGYVHISSGLGEADPTCLVIVPLKVNGETYGIVELASFKVIEKYQIEFIEKIGETIASTIANVKTNMNTQKLLEESHQKGERLIQQEAEVHKTIETLKSKIENLEEVNKRERVKYQKLHDDFENQAETNQSVIQKLNEKSDQLTSELSKYTFILNNSAGYFELDAQGFFTSMNQRMLHVVDMQFSELENHDLRSFMTLDDNIKDFNEGLKKLADGLIYTSIARYSFNGKIIYLNQTFSPIRDEYNVLLRVCVVAKDITAPYERIANLQSQLAEYKSNAEAAKTSGSE